MATIFTSDGGEVHIEDFDADSALDLIQELQDEESQQFLTFDVDGDTVVVNRDQITRIDIDG